MRILALALLLAATLPAADWGFNGRWDITVPDEARGRAWWLEIQGAPNGLKGSFVGYPGGDTDAIPLAWVENGELHMVFERQRHTGKGGPKQEYTMKLAGPDRIEGVMTAGNTTLKFFGVRAPMLENEMEDGTWKKGKPVKLFNGKDLTGWHASKSKADLGWTVEDGMLRSKGGARNLVTDGNYWNYELHLEYKVGPHSNSGVGLRGRYEVQILEDYGELPNTHSNGAIYSRIAPNRNAGKPAGEWQTYDIRLVGRYVTVTLNGKKVVDRGYIQGLTAIADNPDEGKPGPLSLQGDHGPVDFRNIVLTPLTK